MTAERESLTARMIGENRARDTGRGAAARAGRNAAGAMIVDSMAATIVQ